MQHPWMTFFVVIFIIWSISENLNSIFRGKRRFVENLDMKGVVKMSNGKPSGNSSNRSPKGGRSILNERGSQTVPPSLTSAPPPPPKQK